MKSKITVILAILFLVIFSWSGKIDKYSDDYIDSALIKAGSAYAVARGTNAVVSMLETTTVNVSLGVGGSISIGEVLDPINDLIERFSQVMTVALSSLVMQKILLTIASDSFFSISISFFGVLAIVFLFVRRWPDFSSLLIKAFLLLAVVRFSLGFAVLANSMVDRLFLSEQIESSTVKLGNFQTTMKNLEVGTELSETEFQNFKKEIQENNKKLKNIVDIEVPEFVGRLNKTNQKLGILELKLDSYGTKEKLLSVFQDGDVSNIKKQISHEEQKKSDLEDKIEEKNDEIEDIKEIIRHLQAKLSGEEEGIMFKLKSIKNNLSPENVERKVANIVKDIIRLLALFVLTTVILPVAFFYLLVNAAKTIWRIDWSSIVDNQDKITLNTVKKSQAMT
jgi:predicted  nucleic acid-binding Zn-ribbon protein